MHRAPSARRAYAAPIRTLHRQSADATAPTTALELVVKKHAFTLSFQNEVERDSFLRIWVNGVPESAVPRPLLELFYDQAVGAALVAAPDGGTSTPRQRLVLQSETAVPEAVEGDLPRR